MWYRLNVYLDILSVNATIHEVVEYGVFTRDSTLSVARKNAPESPSNEAQRAGTGRLGYVENPPGISPTRESLVS